MVRESGASRCLYSRILCCFPHFSSFPFPHFTGRIFQCRFFFFDGFLLKCLYLNFSVPDFKLRCHPVSARNRAFPGSAPRSLRAPSPASNKSLNSSSYDSPILWYCPQGRDWELIHLSVCAIVIIALTLNSYFVLRTKLISVLLPATKF